MATVCRCDQNLVSFFTETSYHDEYRVKTSLQYLSFHLYVEARSKNNCGHYGLMGPPKENLRIEVIQYKTAQPVAR